MSKHHDKNATVNDTVNNDFTANITYGLHA